MPRLILGPVLRHVGTTDATIWVETDEACTVEVRTCERASSARTFTIAGHSYALVVVRGLETGSGAPYEVLLDGEQAWPDPASSRPPSLIRTLSPGRPIDLLFGSCRSPATVVVRDPTGSGEDVLAAYARGIAAMPAAGWPDALLMLGDQVYADETSEESVRYFATRRDVTKAPHTQVADFEEYTRLYLESWGDPDIRWLLSTIPSSMIFDDHDVIDDWNTSASWRRDVERTGWWEERILGALESYWVYQHVGNLSPDALEQDELYRAVMSLPDATDLLRRSVATADRGVEDHGRMVWSYRRDLGPVRLLVVDSRAGRVLSDGRRAMLGDAEFDWLERQTEDGGYDHLVVATSVPWLLPGALHDLESADEAIAEGARGPLLAWLGERLRRAVDLEHWAAFRASFDRLARLIVRVGTGRAGGRPPASICVLSGDVHHTYASEAVFAAPMKSRVYQLTCSPFHNSIPSPMRIVFHVGWSHAAQRFTAWLARFARVAPVGFEWNTIAGPYFGNHVGLLRFEGRSATFSLAKSTLQDGVTLAARVDDATRDLTPIGPGPEPRAAAATA
ncbi:MAG TPA: alkaline phosphatase D family protein [Candidatus Dormibacteraeota bacterium]|nr:alkaline phosphatase D family protein [Candidatus Dormibacteraeota bacterium]